MSNQNPDRHSAALPIALAILLGVAVIAAMVAFLYLVVGPDKPPPAPAPAAAANVTVQEEKVSLTFNSGKTCSWTSSSTGITSFSENCWTEQAYPDKGNTWKLSQTTNIWTLYDCNGNPVKNWQQFHGTVTVDQSGNLHFADSKDGIVATRLTNGALIRRNRDRQIVYVQASNGSSLAFEYDASGAIRSVTTYSIKGDEQILARIYPDDQRYYLAKLEEGDLVATGEPVDVSFSLDADGNLKKVYADGCYAIVRTSGVVELHSK